MTPIKRAAEIFSTRGEDGPDIHEEFLGIIDSNNARLARLINDGQGLTRIESGKMGREVSRMGLPNVVTTDVDSTHALNFKKTVTLGVG